jgi:hypothetical protein
LPNSLSNTGLTVATQAELVNIFTTAAQQIYGPNITLTSGTPDFEWMMTFIQAVLDVLDLNSAIFTGFAPSQAIGIGQDMLYAINGIKRIGGTYTVTPITIVTSTSVNLYGLDQTAQAVYTVSDSANNLYQLMTTELGVSIGTNVFNFQAVTIGAVTPVPNTITVQQTVVLGVTSVNNPTVAISIGINQESDALFKIRQAKSTSLGSQGYLAGLYAALANTPGVTSAYIYENNTASAIQIDPDDLVPGHTIWVIVAGSAAASAIANAIYIKRNAGCGMYGSQSYNVTQVDGTTFEVFWDDVTTINLFISFTATSLNGTTAPAISAILSGIPLSFVPTAFQEVNINALATQVQIIDSNTLVTNAGFSTGQIQTITLSGVAASGNFYINYNGSFSTEFAYTASASSIQTELRTLTGDAGLTVTGTPESGPIVVTFAIQSIAALLFVPIFGTKASTLETSGSALITFSYNEGYTNTLLPNSRKYQFVVQSSDIVITPLVMVPATSAGIVPSTGTVQFTTYGGYSTYNYTISINNSGASIVASTGLYTAGATPLVTDTITVTDVFGNTATATVAVS